MIEYLLPFGAAILFACNNILAKKSVKEVGFHRSLLYGYVFLVPLLFAGALITRQSFTFNDHLVIPYLIQIIVGAIAIGAFFKALEGENATVVAAISSAYVVAVLAVSIMFLGEQISLVKLAGALLIIASACMLAFEDHRVLKFRKGMTYLLVAMIGWAYYFSSIKGFVTELGPYMTSLYLETGITITILLGMIAFRKDIALPEGSALRDIFLRSGVLFLFSVGYAFSVTVVGGGLTSAIVASNNIITALLASAVLKEKLDRLQHIAVAVMVVGLAIVFLG